MRSAFLNRVSRLVQCNQEASRRSISRLRIRDARTPHGKIGKALRRNQGS
jgi:hypothetical protein